MSDLGGDSTERLVHVYPARLDGWIDTARSTFLDAHENGSSGPAGAADPGLLRAFEVDEELAEFTYAATFLPTWLYAAAAGLRSLLAQDAELSAP